MQSQLKQPQDFLADIDKLILKSMWKGERARIAITILAVKVGEGLILPNLKITLNLL